MRAFLSRSPIVPALAPKKVSVKTVDCKTADDLMRTLEAIAREEEPTISRGHGDFRWHLIPSAWRHGVLTKLHNSIEQQIGPHYRDYLPLHWNKDDRGIAEEFLGPGTDASAVPMVRRLIVWLLTEIELVTRFCGFCDRIALPVPGYADARSAVEITDHVELLDGGKRLSYFRRVTPVFELGPVFAFAQHYRIPTRLLDFSDNPLKAAYFAVAEPTPYADEMDLPFAVWVLRKEHDDDARRNQLRTQEFRALRSQIPFLHAQDGLFLSSNVASNRHFMELGRWPTLIETLQGWTAEKIVCPHSERDKLKRLLEHTGISDLTMRPSYESVSDVVRLSCLG